MPFGTVLVGLLVSLLGAGCAGPEYRSQAPDRTDVGEARRLTVSTEPGRQPLSLMAAAAIAEPVFAVIAEDAAKICRTVAAAHTCMAPAFEVVDDDHLNARAGYNPRHRPEISLTRGLVEQLHGQRDELALVIGHEFGHLIDAHVKKRPQVSSGQTDGALSPMVSAVGAAGVAASAGRDAQDLDYRRAAAGTGHSAAEIAEYLESTADPAGDYDWFSRAEEVEADYLGTYLAVRNGFRPTGSGLLEIGALQQRDELQPWEKEDRRLSFSYWDTHPMSPERVARIFETLQEIEALKSQGYARPLPPRLIEALRDNNAAFHSLEELVAAPP
jgi:Zn-dependent protease with chaperone function